METKFTPGPWVRTDAFGPSLTGTCVSEVGGRQHMICSCTGYFGRDGAHANARLIAAAPDMFEAIRAAIDSGILIGGKGEEAVSKEAMALLSAALAKAEGQP